MSIRNLNVCLDISDFEFIIGDRKSVASDVVADAST